VAAELVAAEGRSALTVRRVADAAEQSTTIVSHYFTDIADLMHATYQVAVQRALHRIEAVLADDSTDVVGLIEALLPLDEDRRKDWRIWLAFWNEALASEAFAGEQRQRARTTARRIRNCLTQLRDDGRVDLSVDVDRASDRFAALIPGLAVEAIFDPVKWTTARQRRVIHDELEQIGFVPAAAQGPRR
jgi:AcrR family transcriptional regulator